MPALPPSLDVIRASYCDASDDTLLAIHLLDPIFCPPMGCLNEIVMVYLVGTGIFPSPPLSLTPSSLLRHAGLQFLVVIVRPLNDLGGIKNGIALAGPRPSSNSRVVVTSFSHRSNFEGLVPTVLEFD